LSLLLNFRHCKTCILPEDKKKDSDDEAERLKSKTTNKPWKKIRGTIAALIVHFREPEKPHECNPPPPLKKCDE